MEKIPLYSKLSPLPLGAVRAKGFLLDQLLRSRDGMGGHLDEIEPGMIADPYIRKTYVKMWGDGDQDGWGAEISGNYYAALVELAFTSGDQYLIDKATAWIEAVMGTQREDGYFGTYREEGALIYDDYNAWGTACALRAFLFFYEATGRTDVLDAAHRCLLWFAKNWAGECKTCYAGGFIIEPSVWCYKLTGDRILLDFAKEYTEYLAKNTIFDNSYLHYADKKLHYFGNHSAAYGTFSRMPAVMYEVTGEKKYLDSSKTAIAKLERSALHLSGGISTVIEYLAPVSSTHETEYCSFSFLLTSLISIGAVSGNGHYADLAETLFFNGAQGARRKDERSIAYLTAPNQVFATEISTNSNASNNMRNHVYAPCYPVSCCPVTSVAVPPDYVRALAMTDKRGNLYLAAYGPCRVTYGGFTVEEKTEYPFRDTVSFSVKAPDGKHVYCRLPGWCDAPDVTVDGEKFDTIVVKNGYFALPFVGGKHEVTLRFPMTVKVHKVDDRAAGGKRPIALTYGPLLFSYPIETVWEAFYPETETPLAPEWPWYRALPKAPEPDHPMDAHELLGWRREHLPYAVCLDPALKPEDVEVVFPKEKGYPWEVPQVKLRLTAYHAPHLFPPYNERTYEPFGNVIDEIDGKVTVELVPYGCTNLRITYFPKAKV